MQDAEAAEATEALLQRELATYTSHNALLVVLLVQDAEAAEATEALIQRELARQEGVHAQHLTNALRVRCVLCL